MVLGFISRDYYFFSLSSSVLLSHLMSIKHCATPLLQRLVRKPGPWLLRLLDYWDRQTYEYSVMLQGSNIDVHTGDRGQTKKGVIHSSKETERGKCAHHTRFFRRRDAWSESWKLVCGHQWTVNFQGKARSTSTGLRLWNRLVSKKVQTVQPDWTWGVHVGMLCVCLCVCVCVCVCV